MSLCFLDIAEKQVCQQQRGSKINGGQLGKPFHRKLLVGAVQTDPGV